MLEGTPSTTSQRPAFTVLRKKPRRCAHQVYSTRRPNSSPISVASLFSKPSPFRFENGRLFGSEQTRSASAARAWRANRVPVTATATIVANATPDTINARRPRGRKPVVRSARIAQSEHVEHAAERRLLRQILHGVDEAESRRRVAGVRAEHHRARPPADAGQHRDVLMAVRGAEAD